MKIVTLIENEVSHNHENLQAEAGLSLYIESGDKKILFDTGSSGAMADNAEKLGIDLSRIDMVIISHAHFDHSGGLLRFFQINNTAKVYISEKVKGDFYYKILFLKKYIGTDKEILEKHVDRFIFVDGDYELSDKIKLVSDISLNHKMPSDSKRIMKKTNGKLVPDSFDHEQMLVIYEDEKVYCFTGCSHHGILNMVETIQDSSKGKKLFVIGGFHMYNPVTKGLSEKKEDVINVAKHLNEIKNIDTIATGHCTGRGAYKILKSVLGNKLVDINTGSSINI